MSKMPFENKIIFFGFLYILSGLIVSYIPPYGNGVCDWYFIFFLHYIIVPFVHSIPLAIAIIAIKKKFASFSKVILIGSTITFILYWLISFLLFHYKSYYFSFASFGGWVLYFAMPIIYYGLAKLFFRD